MLNYQKNVSINLVYIMFFVKNESYLKICILFHILQNVKKCNFNFSLLIHPKMKSNFLGEGCHVFMNEIEIRIEGKFEGERFKEIPSSSWKNDDRIMKILHEERLN